ncbi:response regulator [Candidatus Woesearchaeota archaeon]|nr:response regulator [Candidatus Woesearchaeota archaeon]
MASKVMIVDDSIMMRTVVRSFVDKIPGFEVTVMAENGKVALAALEKHPDLSLILLDIEMPEMDGLEFLRFAKLKSKAKVIILSSVALAGSPHAAKARLLGADAIVTKPSGAVSMDLEDKRGQELVAIMRKLAG